MSSQISSKRIAPLMLEVGIGSHLVICSQIMVVLPVLQRGKKGAITSSLWNQTKKLRPTSSHGLCNS